LNAFAFIYKKRYIVRFSISRIGLICGRCINGLEIRTTTLNIAMKNKKILIFQLMILISMAGCTSSDPVYVVPAGPGFPPPPGPFFEQPGGPGFAPPPPGPRFGPPPPP
jgi:hypothetical protein